jgi:DNA-binding winged helix-turn-helix (wHTH) protein/tetratricopeptide (TPR) repeat protein/TolB-like protein
VDARGGVVTGMNSAVTPTDRRLYRFDEYLVDPVRRLLLQNGEPVAVTPKAFSLLLALLEQPGAVVDKADLFSKVWPDTHVTEANLTQNVSFLRKALGERAETRRYVATVPGQGYSFVGDVQILIADPVEPPPPRLSESGVFRRLGGHLTPAGAIPLPVLPAPQVSPEAALPASPLEAPSPAEPAAPRRGIGALVLPLTLLLLLGVAGVVWVAVRRAAPPAAPVARGAAGGSIADAGGAVAPVRPVVAVLGFRNLSRTQEGQWLAPALAEFLTTELGAGVNVRMISGENVARARKALALPYSESGQSYDLERLRSFLGADLVVVGSYVYMGSAAERKIRLDIRVLKLPEGVAVASVAETGTEAGLIDLVARTGVDLRRALGLSDLSAEQTREAQAQHPASPEAARLYTQGLARLRTLDFLTARNFLLEAAKADPKSALIHSTLAQAWASLGYDARAVEEANRARDLAGSLSREERLELEGRFQAARRQWGKASDVYRSLWTFFPDDLEYGLRLVDCLSQAGRSTEAMDTVAALRKLPPPASDDPRIDVMEAQTARGMSDMATVARAATAAVTKGRTSGESLVVGQALLLQGSAPLFTGRPRDALGPFQEARDIYDRAGYRSGVAVAEIHIGLALYRNGDLDAAEAELRKAVAIFQEIGEIRGIAAGLGNLGLLYQSKGDPTRALSFLEQSKAQFAEIDDPVLEGRVLYSLANVRLSLGDFTAAREGSEQVLVKSRRTGNRADEGRALANLGSILAAHGSLVEARDYFDRSLEILRMVHDPAFLAPVLVDSVDVLARLGDLAGARTQAEQGLTAARQTGQRLGTAKMLGALAGLALRAGDLAAARTQTEEQLRLAREIGAHDMIGSALQLQGRIALAAGDLNGAHKSLQGALQEAGSGGETLRWSSVRLDLAGLALAADRPAEAVQIARAVVAWCAPREMRSEEAWALSILAEALFQQGFFAEARQAAAEARSLLEDSADLQLRASISARLALLAAAGGEEAATLRGLRQAIAEATKAELTPAALEARLALGSILLDHADGTSGRAELAAVQGEAKARGLGLLARRAAERMAQRDRMRRTS